MKQIVRKIFSAGFLKVAFVVVVIIIVASAGVLVFRHFDRVQAKAKIAVANTEYKRGKNNLSQLSGQITNHDSRERSVSLKALFYSPQGGAVGRAVGDVANLQAGETRTFYLYTTSDVSGFSDYKIEVTSAN